MLVPAYADETVTLYQGDCLEVLRTLEANSIDACITDPPYLLNFMGKDFDTQHKGLPGANEGQRMQAWHLSWATEVLRVLKPGGYCLAMGGTRTVHRLTCALEDAGFEVRDQLIYLYGSGWPKSMDISKAIDKEAEMEREMVSERIRRGDKKSYKTTGNSIFAGDKTGEISAPATDAAKEWDGWGSALKPAVEIIVLCRKPLDGTLAQNAQRWGTGGLHIEACRILTDELKGRVYRNSGDALTWGGTYGKGTVEGNPIGRWPANILTDGSAAIHAMFPETTSNGTAAHHADRGKDAGRFGAFAGRKRGQDWPAHAGSAARFFAVCPPDEPPQRFLYTSKVSSEERGSSTHPTQKPLSLLTWLLELVTRPGALVLDPFLGSGTTAVACHRLKRHCIGIEREAEYLAIARARMEAEWHQEQQTLF